MLTLAKLALRELRHQPGFALFFIVNLALGLAGAMALDGLQGSIERTLVARSRSHLGADVRVTSARPLARGEQTRLAEAAAAAGAETVGTAELVQLYSMVAANGLARLGEIRAIDGAFPLHGRIVLSSGVVDDGRRRELGQRRQAWADSSLLEQLRVAPGDTIRLGDASFEVADTILRDTGLSVRAASLAPRIYISREHLAGTGLVRSGTSRAEFQQLFAFGADGDARAVAAAMRAHLDDARIHIASHDEAIEEISAGYERVTRYLGLVSLVALALAGVACAYLFRAFLGQRLVNLAVLMSVGARRGRAHGLLLIELAVLGAAATAAAVLVASVAMPLLARLLGDLLPENVELRIGAREILPSLAVALAVGPLCCLPLLARLRTLRVAELFQEHTRLSLQRTRLEPLLYAPALALLLAIAASRTGDLRNAATFVALVVAAFALTALLGSAVLTALSRSGRVDAVPVRLALRSLAPHRRASLTAFVAVALSALLLSLPAQMRVLLQEQLRPPAPEDVPSLFLFDIQPEQVEPLREHIAAAGVRVQRMAPMVRARLDSINGEPVARSGRAEGGTGNDRRAMSLDERRRLRDRRYNLTYQSELASTEALVAGEDFRGTYDPASGEPAQMSMEVDFARRLGVGLGDELRFDVQGVPVDGRIINLRSVEWNSMQPNFFVSFQPGVLEPAPAVFLASVPALPPSVRDRLQASIVERFPNISMIDVSRGIDRLMELLGQLRWAIASTAVTSLAVGLLLVLAIARDEARARRWDLNMLKVLGARHGVLRRSTDVEFGVLGLAAAVIGCAAGVGVSAGLAAGPLNVPWLPAWRALLAIVIALPLITVLAARLAMRRVLSERPLALLR